MGVQAVYFTNIGLLKILDWTFWKHIHVVTYMMLSGFFFLFQTLLFVKFEKCLLFSLYRGDYFSRESKLFPSAKRRLPNLFPNFFPASKLQVPPNLPGVYLCVFIEVDFEK